MRREKKLMRAPAQLVLGYLDCPRTQWMSRLSERSPCPEKRRSRKYWYYKTGELGDVVMKLGFFPRLRVIIVCCCKEITHTKKHSFQVWPSRLLRVWDCSRLDSGAFKNWKSLTDLSGKGSYFAFQKQSVQFLRVFYDEFKLRSVGHEIVDWTD